MSEPQLDLKAKLRAAGMSQFDLARASGVHPSQISRACSGMQLSPDAERRVFEVLDPPKCSSTPSQPVQVSADA